jgi:hypothetical protein
MRNYVGFQALTAAAVKCTIDSTKTSAKFTDVSGLHTTYIFRVEE